MSDEIRRRPESVTVVYADAAHGYVRRGVTEAQPAGEVVDAGRHETVEAYGCQSDAQARRLAKWMLVDGMLCQPSAPRQGLMTQVRLLLSDVLLGWAFDILPRDREEKKRLAKFVQEYFRKAPPR